MKIILPSFYPPDDDDIAIAIDPDLDYDDAIVNEAIYPDLTQGEIDALLNSDDE